MIKVKNGWNILLYALFLIVIAVSIVYIIFSKSIQYITDIQFQRYSIKLNKNLQEKAEMAFKYNSYVNNNWSWFTDTRACPSEVTLSGTTESWTLINITNIVSYFDWNNIFCSWSSASWNLLIAYSDDFLNYSEASYISTNFSNLNSDWIINIIWWNTFTWIYFTWIINNVEQSYISFTWWLNISWIDSNYNSDNYTVYSTWFINYPNWYIDDDVNARLTLYWYIEKWLWYYNIFWNNYLTNAYINNNPNNSDLIHEVIWNTSTWYLRLEVDNSCNIKIVEFNSWSYRATKELKEINEWKWSSFTWAIWYISQNGSGAIYLNSNTWSAKIFNFKSKDYAIFLSFSWNLTNTWATLLRYKLRAENSDWKKIFISPIDDSLFWNSNGWTKWWVVMGLSKFWFSPLISLTGYQKEDMMKYLANDIIINDAWNYISKEMEIVQQ